MKLKPLADIIRLRFLDRFASYFGLVEYIVDPRLPYLERGRKSQLKTTQLFSEALCWFSTNQQKSKQMFNEVGNDFLH